MAYVKKSQNEYLYKKEHLFTNNNSINSRKKVIGIIFTDDVKVFKIKEDLNIKLVKVGELSKLKVVFTNIN